MKSKTDLFRLIRAMSRSEKRYFALDAQKAGKKKSKYLELFKLINAMDEYDETKLKAKFSKHLSVDKAYLYDAILRSMRDYHSKKSRAAQIKEKILDAKYLYERELYDLCEESLQEAKVLAEELGDNLALLEINKQERLLIRISKKTEYVSTLVEAKEHRVEALREELGFLDLYDEMAKHIIEGKKLNGHFDEKLGALLQKEETSLISTFSTRRFYQCKGLQHQILGDIDAVLKYFEKLIKWWDNNPKYKEEEFYSYVTDMYNLLVICFKKENYSRINQLMKVLESEHPSNPHHQKVLFQSIHKFKLLYFINLGIIDEVNALAEEISKGLQVFTINTNFQNELIANMAVLFFIAEDFEKCLGWCDKLLKSKQRNHTELEIYRSTHFLKLIASYEIDEHNQLESITRSTYRTLLKKALDDDEYYSKLLKSFKKLLNSTPDAFKKSLTELKNDIELLRENLGRRERLGIDELIIRWIESKQAKKSIFETIRTKYRA